MKTSLICAICTPLRNDESLHIEGLAAHLDDQWRHGVAGVFVAGTMGRMQLLSDKTYQDLVRYSASLAAGCGEIMVGVGDTSFVRTLQRIQYVEQFNVDGLVVLAPFLHPLSQSELIDYFCGLADHAQKPLYLYDNPYLINTKLDIETVLELSKHPNIRGIKCSSDWAWTRHLMSRIDGTFRVIPAQAELVDMLVRCGVRDNLDGIFAVVPDLLESIVEAAELGDWELAAAQQKKMTGLLCLLRTKYPLLPACSAILNARGIPGQVFPSPLKPLMPQEREQLFAEPLICTLLNRPANGDGVARSPRRPLSDSCGNGDVVYQSGVGSHDS